MIVKRYWRKYRHHYSQFSDRKGYFLFCVIPIYIKCGPWR